MFAGAGKIRWCRLFSNAGILCSERTNAVSVAQPKAMCEQPSYEKQDPSRMPFKSSNAMLVVLIALVGIAFFGLVHAIIGSGRSVGAYVLGALALITCLVLILVMMAAVGWILDRIAERLKR